MLRKGDRPQNLAGIGHKRHRQGYKGVHWNSARQSWYASITVNQVDHYLGCYENSMFAALAYDAAALQLHSRPVLNFPKRNT